MTCAIDDTRLQRRAGLRLLDIIGEDNVMRECDYPDKITVGNASRVCNFTPADPASISFP